MQLSELQGPSTLDRGGGWPPGRKEVELYIRHKCLLVISYVSPVSRVPRTKPGTVKGLRDLCLRCVQVSSISLHLGLQSGVGQGLRQVLDLCLGDSVKKRNFTNVGNVSLHLNIFFFSYFLN